jgi:hypothetical protein
MDPVWHLRSSSGRRFSRSQWPIFSRINGQQLDKPACHQQDQPGFKDQYG